MMKTLVKIIFLLFVALLVTGMIVPSFINWGAHKEEVIARLTPYIKGKIEVTGPVSLRLLPKPRLSLEDVTISGADGKKLLALKSIDTKIKIGALLQGRAETEEVNLTGPEIDLTNGVPDIFPEGNALVLNQIKLSDGILHYGDKTFTKANLSVTAGTIEGPYKVEGDALYQDIKVVIALETGAFAKGTSSAPFTLSLTPEKDLPKLKLIGDLSLKDGPDFAGEMTISDAPLPPIKGLAFLSAAPIEATATVSLKKGQFALNDIKGYFVKKEKEQEKAPAAEKTEEKKEGEKTEAKPEEKAEEKKEEKKEEAKDAHAEAKPEDKKEEKPAEKKEVVKAGTFKGKITVRYAANARPVVMVDLEGDDLVFPADIVLPTAFSGSVHFKGQKVTWGETPLSSLDISASFDGGKWEIKSARFEGLTGNTKAVLAGSITPSTELSSWSSVDIETEDSPAFLQSLKLPATNILTLLPYKKLHVTTSLDVTPAKLSLYNINATVDGKASVTGVVNIDRTAERPNADAKLHFQDWDAANLPGALLAADTTLELTAGNLALGGQVLNTLALKGRSNAQGVDIDSLVGTFADKDSFSFKGHAATLSPLAGLEGGYAMRAAKIGGEIKLPPGLALKNVEARGNIKGDGGQYAWTAEGKAGTLTWKDAEVSAATFSIDATKPEAFRLDIQNGTLWGGKLETKALFKGDDYILKGSLKDVQLQGLLEKMGFTGLKAAAGQLAFDLGKAGGNVDVQTPQLTIANFNGDKLAETLRKQTSMPENVGKIVEESLTKSGSTTFRNVHTQLRVAASRVGLAGVMLENEIEKMTLNGTADIPSGASELTGTLRLLQPEGFPLVSFKYDGKALRIDNSKGLEDYVVKHLTALPQATLDDGEEKPIEDILKRLDAAEQPPVPLGQ